MVLDERSSKKRAQGKAKQGSDKWKSCKDKVYTYSLRLEDQDEAMNSTETPEAHLYITPKRQIGSGHHSRVYQVEMELPRELVVKPRQCNECTFEEEPVAMELEGEGEMKPEMPRLKSHQHAPYCEHLDDGIPRPRTAKVSMTAKLTIPDDKKYDDYGSHTAHLRREAKNYCAFREFMFEHWNGYNIIYPCRDPIPVGAVVPQFYGYYVPDESNAPIEEGKFMSPILLLEHCGKAVQMSDLTLEER